VANATAVCMRICGVKDMCVLYVLRPSLSQSKPKRRQVLLLRNRRVETEGGGELGWGVQYNVDADDAVSKINASQDGRRDDVWESELKMNQPLCRLPRVESKQEW